LRAIITSTDEFVGNQTVEVSKVVSAGILTNDNAGDEIDEKLIPWHRVLEVSSKVEGELFLETGR